MEDLNDKATGGTLTAIQWNQPMSEIQKLIEDSGQTLSSADVEQLSKSTAVVVATKAIAEAITPVDGRKIFITSADGGEFTMRTGASVGTYNDNGGAYTGTQFTVGDGSSGFLRDYNGVINVEWFGAKLDDLTDDVTAWQNCVDYAEIDGGEISFDGPSRISSAITIDDHNVTISGTGKHCLIQTTSTTADVFILGNGTDEIRNINFRYFSVSATVTKTAGYTFHSQKGARCRWEEVFIGPLEEPQRLWDGIYFDRFDYVVIDKCIIRVLNDGVKCRGNANQTNGAELTITGGTRIIGARYGLHIGGACGGVRVVAADIIVSTIYNVLIDDTLQSGAPNREVFIGSEVSIDGAGSVGIKVLTNSITHLDIDGTWISSNGTVNDTAPGINIDPTQLGGMHVSLSKPRIFNNGGSGFVMNDGSFTLSGGFIRSNGQGASGGHGVDIANINTTPFAITGMLISNNGDGSKGYGINIASGSHDNFSIVGNLFNLNGQGSISSAATVSKTRIIRDNVGYATANAADGTITSGNTSVVITHALDETPAAENIYIIGKEDPDNSVGTIWIDTITSTQFTVNVENDPGASNWTFGWQAIIV
jgi:hypothetical protein